MSKFKGCGTRDEVPNRESRLFNSKHERYYLSIPESRPIEGGNTLNGDARVVKFAHWVIRWRWPIIALSVLILIGAARGGRYLSMSTDYRIFFSDRNPYLDAHDSLEKVYTKDDNISFIIKPGSGDVFTPTFLSDIRELTQASWQIPHSRRVDSLTNYQHTFAEGDDLTVQDLVIDPDHLSSESLARVREIALNEPLLVDRIISRDGTTTNVTVTFNRPDNIQDEQPAIMRAIRALAEDFRNKNPDARVAITGVMALNNAFFESGQRDVMTLIPLMYGVLLIVMAVLLRSVSGTVATLLVIGFSAATAMGLAGWAHVKLTPISLIAPTIILTIAIADSIHLLVTLFKEMRGGAPEYLTEMWG